MNNKHTLRFYKLDRTEEFDSGQEAEDVMKQCRELPETENNLEAFCGLLICDNFVVVMSHRIRQMR